MSRSYLLGAMHDGTVRRRTIKIAQKEESYIQFIRHMVEDLGARAWTYREGKERNIYVVEFSRARMILSKPRTRDEKIDYIRGYFDAEGGVPATSSQDPYIYFAQKDREDLEEVRTMLVSLGLRCGRIHNPSRHADASYWRFYVSRGSHGRFAKLIGSWHPRKREALAALRTVRRA